MELFWQEHKIGLRLILRAENLEQIEVGAIRKTPRGYDAWAKTMGYDPGRAQRNIPSLEEAKAFVESFRPWELFSDDNDLELEGDVRPADS